MQNEGRAKMRILYDPRATITLRDFGILIPVDVNKTKRIWQRVREEESARSSPSLLSFESENFLQNPKFHLHREDLLRVHSPEMTEMFLSASEEFFYDAYELLDKEGKYHRFDPSLATKEFQALTQQILDNSSGTFAALLYAQRENAAFWLGGGMHHAHYDFSHGFCPINDIAIGVKKFLAENAGDTRVWIIDVDAHRGDGTAALFHEEARVLTFSLHTKEGWPNDLPRLDKRGKPASYTIPSDLDIGLTYGEDDLYLPRLREALEGWEEREESPDIVLIVGGSDPYEYDELPSSREIQLTLPQMDERNLFLYDWFSQRNIPQAWVMSGGYGERSWEPVYSFLSHLQKREVKG